MRTQLKEYFIKNLKKIWKNGEHIFYIFLCLRHKQHN